MVYPPTLDTIGCVTCTMGDLIYEELIFSALHHTERDVHQAGFAPAIFPLNLDVVTDYHSRILS